MNAEQFVDVVREVVMKAAAKDVIRILECPPGRKPAPELTALSEWWQDLDENDRSYARMLATEVSHAAVFGFLCVIDGVRAIEDDPNKGNLELAFNKDGERTVISSVHFGDGLLLHELLNSESWRDDTRQGGLA